ncbi:MAG TPA: archaeosortase/exosortase family protein [Polyangiaceae bacterium]|nr:archaeosortase/exosortase family protein [Polyangiaceae bacterium]
MSTLSRWWSRATPAGFLTRFLLIGGLAFAIYAFPTELLGSRQDWLSWYLAGYARLAGGLLRLFDPSIVVAGNVIEGRFPLQIVRTCDAAEVTILVSAAILAFPGRARQKLLALSVALPSLVAANLLRICSLYFVGVHRPNWFKASHEEIWPLLLVMFAAFVFLCSVRFLQAEKGKLGAVASH